MKPTREQVEALARALEDRADDRNNLYSGADADRAHEAAAMLRALASEPKSQGEPDFDDIAKRLEADVTETGSTIHGVAKVYLRSLYATGCTSMEHEKNTMATLAYERGQEIEQLEKLLVLRTVSSGFVFGIGFLHWLFFGSK